MRSDMGEASRHGKWHTRKLTAELAAAMRREFTPPMSPAKLMMLARKYGCSIHTARDTITRRIWKSAEA